MKLVDVDGIERNVDDVFVEVWRSGINQNKVYFVTGITYFDVMRRYYTLRVSMNEDAALDYACSLKLKLANESDSNII